MGALVVPSGGTGCALTPSLSLRERELATPPAGCLRRGDVKLETALQIANGAEGQMCGREFSVPSAQVLARVEE